MFTSEEETKFTEEEIKLMHVDWVHKIKTWEKAVNSWIIGPGLGRDKYMLDFFPTLVRNIREGSIVVFDADGIYYLCQHPELFPELKKFKTILTPNFRECGFLQKHLNFNIE